MKQKDGEKVMFDRDIAAQVTVAFTESTGVSCRLFAADGRELLFCGDKGFCPRLAKAVGRDFHCDALHRYGVSQSERFGGRYIYFCPMGMAFFVSPVMSGGVLAGALIGGPVQIMETEDQLACSAVSAEQLNEEAVEAAKEAMATAPFRDPKQLDALSSQLFANAVYISDSSIDMAVLQSGGEQGSGMEEYIARLRNSGFNVEYPLEKEQEMCQAITNGDIDTASEYLNEILGYIFFYSPDSSVAHTRIEELLVVVTRAAAYGGANLDEVFSLSHRYLRLLRAVDSQADLARWMAASLNSITKLVFRDTDVKHSSVIRKAVNYMKSNYAQKLTLEDVALYVGYSNAYFSHIFKEEMGTTFKEYLNSLRIEKSKAMLVTSSLPLVEICTAVGFNDQSYFCKTFKQVTGVTPDKYRKRIRRIDREKEYGQK